MTWTENSQIKDLKMTLKTYESIFSFFHRHNKRNEHLHTTSHQPVWQTLTTFTTNSISQAMGKQALSYADDVNVNCYSPQRREFGNF